MPYPDPALRPLRSILANLYPTQNDARLLASDAGLDPARIAFTEKSINTWFNILNDANAREKVDQVIKEALKAYPENEQLKRALDHAPPPVIEGPQTGPWNGPAGAGALEKIIGAASALVDIYYLEVGMRRARAIARIKLADGSSGSGFLIDGNTLITNHHVLPNKEAAATAGAQFNYQLTAERTNAPIDEHHFKPETFRTSEADDWSAVAVDGDPVAKWGAIPLARTAVKVGDRVNIVQHPAGGPKQMSLIANVVAFVGGGRVQYLTDTLPGSSGSPVFDADWNIVALHHSGGWLTEPNANAASKRTYYRNEGIAIDRIIDGLAG